MFIVYLYTPTFKQIFYSLFFILLNNYVVNMRNLQDVFINSKHQSIAEILRTFRSETL